MMFTSKIEGDRLPNRDLLGSPDTAVMWEGYVVTRRMKNIIETYYGSMNAKEQEQEEPRIGRIFVNGVQVRP